MSTVRTAGWVCLFLACGATLQADSLHEAIDRAILAGGGQAAARSDDAEFLRRITLDLAGRIPTASEVREFLADADPEKRTKKIDALLASPEYPRRMSEAFHVMLMERLGEHADWTKFLETSFRENKPWDQVVRAILSPNPDDEARRGAAFFYTKRLENYGQQPVDMPALARDVGRLFLGKDLQCAQCHDHLFIDDYKQADFQGLFAFVSHTFIRTDLKFPAVGEKVVDKKLDFMSVFKKEPQTTGPRIPGGSEIEVATFAKGEEFAVAPDRAKNFPGQPKFSPLALLGEQLARPDNAAFVRTSVNRFWFLMLGRGIVHPLDLDHSANPPSHPELLDLLAREFTAHGCDVKWLLRELALTEAYQRSSLLPAGATESPPEKFLVAIEKPLSAEQLLWTTLHATGELARVNPPPATPDAPPAPDFVKAREKFLKAYANPPRDPEIEFAPSVKAALFVMHDPLILAWLEPRDGNLTARAAALPEAPAIADELYLSILGRLATDAEKTEVAEYLAARADKKPQAVAQLAWALLASTEFTVNH